MGQNITISITDQEMYKKIKKLKWGESSKLVQGFFKEYFDSQQSKNVKVNR